MPFDISGALSKERVLSTEIALEGIDGLLPLSYYPNRVGDVQKSLQALQDKPKVDQYADLESAFLTLVASWEVVSQGVPVPLSQEGLASIGMNSVVLGNIINAVVNEAALGEAKGTRLRQRLQS